ncbi:MAG: hypothetical protein WD648_02495 [Planctomycetaceae bacterium]
MRTQNLNTNGRDSSKTARVLIVMLGPCFGCICTIAWAQQATFMVEQSFDTDPGWEGLRNRLLPPRPPVVKQHFGYARTNLAGGRGAGEIGGTIQRSSTRAWYAKSIAEVTLNDRLTATGQFAVTRADSSSGMMFGWFNETSRGWRTPNSLAFRIDGNGAKYWMFYEYGTRNWRTGGGGAFEGDRYQTTETPPFRADGTVHRWSLSYDPRLKEQPGVLTFQVDDRRYTQEVAPEHKADEATFNRFGIWNVQIGGESLDVFFDDLVVNGERESFDADPQWMGAGNEVEFTERVIRPLHDFGYSGTNHACGKPGEVGGIIFRDERPAFYAGACVPLTLDDELQASGRLAFLQAGSDSGICLGWFNASAKREKNTPEHEDRQRSYVAVMIEGPSRVGHYFRPAYSTATGAGGAPMSDPTSGKERPLIRPDGKVHRWSLAYSPRAANGRGQIAITLDGERHTLDLAQGERASGATFDRFGLFNIQAGGHHVEIYLDDLKYTSASK